VSSFGVKGGRKGGVRRYRITALPSMQRSAEHIIQVFCTNPHVKSSSFRVVWSWRYAAPLGAQILTYHTRTLRLEPWTLP